MWLQRLFQKLLEWLHLRQGPQANQYDLNSLDDWMTSPLAENLFNDEKRQLDKTLAELFGYHLLELSPFPLDDLTSGSRINKHWKLSETNLHQSDAVVRFEQLPIMDESTDVVLLHHALDYSHHPHQVLREASRVLIPRGHLVIVGFNPFSMMGLIKLIAQFFTRTGFWRRNALSSRRVNDWLKLLDFEKVVCHHGFYRPPIDNAALLNNLTSIEKFCHNLRLPIGGYYIFVACKDRVGMTPIRPFWGSLKPRPRLTLKPSVTVGESTRNINKPQEREKQN